MIHRCAVCWQVQGDHDRWYEHVTREHDAKVDEFGMHPCRGKPRNDIACWGIQHADKLTNLANQARRRTRLDPLPIRVNGETYTQERLLG